MRGRSGRIVIVAAIVSMSLLLSFPFLNLTDQYGGVAMLNLSGMTVLSSSALAPPIAMALLAHKGPAILYVSLAGMGLIGFLISVNAVGSRPAASPKAVRADSKLDWRMLVDKHVMTACVTYLLWAVAYGALISFLPLYGSARGIANVGMFFSAYAVLSFSVRTQVPRLMKLIGRKLLVAIALSIAAVGVISLCWFGNFYYLVFCGVLFGLGSAGVYTPLACEVVDHVPAAHRNAAMGFFMLNIEIGQTLGAFIFGVASKMLAYPQMFVLAGLVPFIGVLVFLGSSPRNRSGGAPQVTARQ